MRRSGGFGLIALVIVVAIVLFLVASNAKETIPTLEKAQDEAAREVGEESLPGLDEMETSTNEHAKELEEALRDAH